MNEYTPKHRTEIQGKQRLGARLFPPRRVPSFAEVAGSEAAAEYRRDREDQAAQELANRRQSRAVRGLGLCSIDKLLTPAEQEALEQDIISLGKARIPTQEDLDATLD